MSAPATTIGADPFDAALAGIDCQPQLDDGRILRLPVGRWHGEAGGADHWLLEHCRGPTIDLGCGPGRLVRALVAKGLVALGVDASPRANHHCVARGVPVMQRDVFAPLPGEGRWRHAILADGNTGIGGDPLALLRRATSLLRAGGSLLIEVGWEARGLWSGSARLHDAHAIGRWFDWAVLGMDALPRLAQLAGLAIVKHHVGQQRCFVELMMG